MSTGLVNVVQQIAQNAMENNQMTDLRFGTVISIAPLKIKITNNLILPESVLIVPQHLTNYKLELQPSSGTKQKYTIFGALQVGNQVALLRKQGGQNYYILDRI